MYVSNDSGAYNTVLINAQRQWSEATVSFDDNATDQQPNDQTGVYCVTATVTNERTNARLTVPLVNAIDGTVPVDVNPADNAPDALADNYGKFQNFFEVVSDAADTDGRTALTCNDFANAGRRRS